MNTKRVSVSVTGVILDEYVEVTLTEMCHACKVEETVILALVDEGIVEPMARDILPWRFSGTAVPRVARALRLQRDLELNPAGVAFALDLLSEIEELRGRLKIVSQTEGL